MKEYRTKSAVVQAVRLAVGSDAGDWLVIAPDGLQSLFDNDEFEERFEPVLEEDAYPRATSGYVYTYAGPPVQYFSNTQGQWFNIGAASADTVAAKPAGGYFDNFTERARKVLGLARQEAQKFNHEYIGTEHVLLGLLLEGSGTAATVLRERGLNFELARKAIENLVTQGPTMVKTPGKLPFTPRTKNAIDHAKAEAKLLDSSYVGTEHILLGLLKADGIAGTVLKSSGFAYAGVYAIIKDLNNGGNASKCG